jgi:sortase B
MTKRILNFIVLLLVLAGSFLIGLHFWNMYQYNKSLEENERIKDAFYQSIEESDPEDSETVIIEEPERPQEWILREEYLPLLAENKDTVGWVKIDGTTIDLPVVQGEDNQYYLKHAYSGVYSASGTIFMDFRNDIQDDNNILVYGHTIRANNMFADLNHYVNKASGQEYYQEHKELQFNSLYQDSIYDIFAIYIVDLNQEAYYLFPNYEEDEFDTYLDDIRRRSLVESDLQVNQTDQMLTLVTCYPPLDDARTIIHAVKR